MRKIIKNGYIVTAADEYYADILIEHEKIVAIAETIDDPTAEIIDATDLYVFPGGIDPHTHLAMPFNQTVTDDDWYSGTKAAAHGGTTTILDFCLTTDQEPLKESVATWHQNAQDQAAIDYGFHLMLPKLDEEKVAELDDLLPAEGITSLKIFMAYAKEFQADDRTLFKAFEYGKKNDVLVMVHCENGSVIDELVEEARSSGHSEPLYHALTRPEALEVEATNRALQLAKVAGAKSYIVHVTCAAALEEIKRAQDAGQEVYGETCPPYLLLTQDKLAEPDFEGAKYVWSPPLREAHNLAPLWQGLANHDLQTVGSDHCSFNFGGKKQLGREDFSKIPNGGPFIEDRFSLLYSEGVAKGRIDLQTFVQVIATNAAKTFDLYPQKGTIAIGSDADLVLYNPKVTRTLQAKTHHMNVDYNAFEGLEVTGQVQDVLVRGQHVIKEGTFVGSHTHGKYLRREAKSRSGA